MKKIILFIVLLLSGQLTSAQNSTPITVNKTYPDFQMSENEAVRYSMKLKKGKHYSIHVEQKGIDVELFLQDHQGKTLQHKDSPNGLYGPEKFIFACDSTAPYTLLVRPFEEPGNTRQGKYAIAVTRLSEKLEKFSLAAVQEDFEVLRNALLETRIGLWYHSHPEFNRYCDQQKKKLRPKMTALELYRALAPIMAYTGEGHSNIRISDLVRVHLRRTARYFPFQVKIIDHKVYLLHDLETYKTRGLQVTSINGRKVSAILDTLLSVQPSDGYNLTGKYDWIEGAFARNYLLFIEEAPTAFDLKLQNPQTGETLHYPEVPAYSYAQVVELFGKLKNELPARGYETAATFSMDTARSTGVLTVNSFNTGSYENGRGGFKEFLAQTFAEIDAAGLEHLVIDVRKNEGGTQEMLDHLLAYLVEKPYPKYDYVEIPGFEYGFIQHTDYKGAPENLRKALESDFYRAIDGRYLDLPGHYAGDAPQPQNFKGKLYILINGLTFSGGSEFCALARNNTGAIFIGEETGGGYYGNTSGHFLQFTLPNSQLTGRIPLCKFVTQNHKRDIPFGRGVLPDHPVSSTVDDYLQGRDLEMEYVRRLIGE